MFRPIHPSALQSPAFGFVYTFGRFFFGQIVPKRASFGNGKKQKSQKSSREGRFHALLGMFVLPFRQFDSEKSLALGSKRLAKSNPTAILGEKCPI